MGIDASPFDAPVGTDDVSIRDDVGNAYVQVYHNASLLRSAVDGTGTARPTNVAAGQETTDFDAAKATLLTALDDTIAQSKIIVDLIKT